VPGFVQTDLAGAGDLEVRDPAPALILDRRYELDALALEFRDGVLDVMTHEEQGVMPGRAAPAGARVDGDLARRQGEDQPALSGIDPFEAQHVVNELPSSLGVLGEDDRVCAGDHGGDRSAGYWSAMPYGRLTSAFSAGQTNPKIGCGWNDAASVAGLPNHSLRTGALTFLPVVPPLSIFSTSTPRYASAV
jgi:hypothetical protein